MAAISEKQILEALSTIPDPDRGGDIVSLGMVSGIVIRDGNVAFAIEVEPERGPRLEPLRKAAERAVEALPEILSVTAVLGATETVAPDFPPPDSEVEREVGKVPGGAELIERHFLKRLGPRIHHAPGNLVPLRPVFRRRRVRGRQ